MNENAIDSENTSTKAKADRVMKPTNKPKANRADKKAEVIALMKRSKGSTLEFAGF